MPVTLELLELERAVVGRHRRAGPVFRPVPGFGDGGPLEAVDGRRRRLAAGQILHELDHRGLELAGQVFVDPTCGLGDFGVSALCGWEQVVPNGGHRRLDVVRQEHGPVLDGIERTHHPNVERLTGDRFADAAGEQLQLAVCIVWIGLADRLGDLVDFLRNGVQPELGSAEPDMRLDVGANPCGRVGVGVEAEALRQEDPGLPRSAAPIGRAFEVDLEVGAVVTAPTGREFGDVRERSPPRRIVEEDGQAHRPVLDPVEASHESFRVASQHGFG